MKKKRFRKQDWLDLGLQTLSDRGPEAMKLEAICASAGLTRGSFYYHFEDHAAFLKGLAERWLEKHTTSLISELDPAIATEDQVTALSDAAMNIDYRLELGIRELGRRTPEVQRIVKMADETRLSIVAALYRVRFDLTEDDARELAFLEYAAFSGLILIDPDMPQDQQRALAARYDHIVETFLKKRNGS